MAYHWGPKPGLIKYFFLEGSRPNTKMDVLSFGFITPLENAVLLRIDSASSSDYLEVEIVSTTKLRSRILKNICGVFFMPYDILLEK